MVMKNTLHGSMWLFFHSDGNIMSKSGLPHMNLFAGFLRSAIEKPSSRCRTGPGKVSQRGCVAFSFGMLPPIETEQVWKDEGNEDRA